MQLKITISKYSETEVNFYINGVRAPAQSNDKKTYIINFPTLHNVKTEHAFQIEFLGKRRLIDQGVDESLITWVIEEFFIDTFNLLPLLGGKIKSSYQHDYNGYGSLTTTEFTSVVGCDGLIKINIITPILHWIIAAKLGV